MLAEATPLGKNKAEGPLYLQLARALKGDIVKGAYPVGTTLPTEEDLCKQYEVSRYTVREALRILREDGLVTSRQGSGTTVIPARLENADIQQVMSINDLVAYAKDTRFDITSVQMAPISQKLAKRTGLKPGEERLVVRGYRYREGLDTPFCITEYFINRAYAAVGRVLQRQAGPVFPLIEDLFGLKINEVQQQIAATLVTDALSRELKVPVGSAALEICRIYKTSNEDIAQVTLNTHPAEHFQHSMTMRRVRA